MKLPADGGFLVRNIVKIATDVDGYRNMTVAAK